MPARLRAEHGASAVSLLVIVAALAVVAVLAIPALTKSGASATGGGQGATALAGAQGQQAQSLLATAQTAVATSVAGSGNGYSDLSAAGLHAIEPTLITFSSTQAYLASASGTATSYTLVAVDPLTHVSFTLADDNGTTSRTCAPARRGGCSASGTF